MIGAILNLIVALFKLFGKQPPAVVVQKQKDKIAELEKQLADQKERERIEKELERQKDEYEKKKREETDISPGKDLFS